MAEVVEKFFADEDSDEGDVDVEEYYEEEEFFLDEDDEPTVMVSIAKFIKQLMSCRRYRPILRTAVSTSVLFV